MNISQVKSYSQLNPLRNQGFDTLPPEVHLPRQDDELAHQYIDGLRKGGKVRKRKGKKSNSDKKVDKKAETKKATASAVVHVHITKGGRKAKASNPPPNVAQGVPTGVNQRELPQQQWNIMNSLSNLRRDFHASQLLLNQAHSQFLTPFDGDRRLVPTNQEYQVPPPRPHQEREDLQDSLIRAGYKFEMYPVVQSGLSNSISQLQEEQQWEAYEEGYNTGYDEAEAERQHIEEGKDEAEAVASSPEAGHETPAQAEVKRRAKKGEGVGYVKKTSEAGADPKKVEQYRKQQETARINREKKNELIKLGLEQQQEAMRKGFPDVRPTAFATGLPVAEPFSEATSSTASSGRKKERKRGDVPVVEANLTSPSPPARPHP